MNRELEFHEAANIFCLMEGPDFEALVEDIRAHGLREPGKLLDGKLLDGRNRYRACRAAGVEFRAEEVEVDDPIAYVISLNKHRRHLSQTQSAMAAAKARDYYDQQAKERQRLSEGRGRKGMENLPHLNQGTARDAAGKAMGVSGKLVDYATKVLRSGCQELIEAVEHDRMAVSSAARLATRSKEEQQVTLESAKKAKRRPRPTEQEEPEEEPVPSKVRGVGVLRGNEAVNALKRIPRNDPLRKRGFQIVADWIRANK